MKTGYGNTDSPPTISSEKGPSNNSISIPFLLSLTNTKIRSVVDLRFSLEAASIKNLDTDSLTTATLRLRSPVDPSWLNFDPGESSPFLHIIPFGEPTDPEPLQDDEYLGPRSRVLQVRIPEIWTELSSVLGMLDRIIFPTAKPPDEQSLVALFTPHNLQAALTAFFQRMHHHYYYLHRPSFTAEHCSSKLLIVIFLAGTIYSYPRDTYHLAVQCFDLLETTIFDCDEFKELEMGNHTYSDGPHPSHLDLLNAALIVIYLQISIQDKLTRRRICGKRFPALVAAAKGLCLFSARHDIYQLRSQLPTARRRSWLKVESMIRYVSFFWGGNASSAK